MHTFHANVTYASAVAGFKYEEMVGRSLVDDVYCPCSNLNAAASHLAGQHKVMPKYQP